MPNMGKSAGETLTDLQALERFVVENDELLELEERIGRFNIFDALGIARREIYHSNFLAWLLDPNESHGQGSLFLKAILMDLLRQAPPEQRAVSPIELDGVELQGVEIHREWRHTGLLIDLLITCKSPQFIIAIENKIDSGEHSDQLSRYRRTVEQEFAEIPPRRRMFVFLTTDAAEASEAGWVSYGYEDIHRVLSRLRKTNKGAVGDDVSAFLDHYLRLIGSRFMDDPKISALCRHIYQKHRQAMELIFEHRPASPESELLDQLHKLISADKRFGIWSRRKTVVYFCPGNWDNELLPIGDGETTDWLYFTLCVDGGRLRLWIEFWGEHVIPDERERAIGAIKTVFKTSDVKRDRKVTRIASTVLLKWPQEVEPPVDTAMQKMEEELDRLYERYKDVPTKLNARWNSRNKK